MTSTNGSPAKGRAGVLDAIDYLITEARDSGDLERLSAFEDLRARVAAAAAPSNPAPLPSGRASTR